MLKLRSIPIPSSHRVRIESAALPVAALASALPFEGLVRRTSEIKDPYLILNLMRRTQDKNTIFKKLHNPLKSLDFSSL